MNRTIRDIELLGNSPNCLACMSLEAVDSVPAHLGNLSFPSLAVG